MAFGRMTDFGRKVWLTSLTSFLWYLTTSRILWYKVVKEAKWLAIDTILINMLVICHCP